MTESAGTGEGNSGVESFSWKPPAWRRPSSWLSPVDTRKGILPTGWIQAFDIANGNVAPRHTGTGHGRGAIALGHRGLWVANQGSRTVVRLEPHSLELSAIQKFDKAPVAIAAGPDAIWAVSSNGWLWRIWPDGRQAEGVARLGRRATAVAAAGDLIWILHRDGRLDGLEPASGEVVSEGKVPRGAGHMVAHDSALWISCGRGRKVVRFDPVTEQPSTAIRFDQRIRCLIAADGILLAGCARRLQPQHGWLHTIDGLNERVASSTDLPSQPRAIAVEGRTAWVACGKGRNREGTIERVDLRSGQVTEWQATYWAVSGLVLLNETLLASMSLAVAVPIVHGEFVGAGGGDGGGGGGEGGSGGN